MNPRLSRWTGAEPAWDALALHTGTIRSGWCHTCKAWTRLSTELLLLTPEGVSAIGTWQWCEICDDPDFPLPARRIDRADS